MNTRNIRSQIVCDTICHSCPCREGDGGSLSAMRVSAGVLFVVVPFFAFMAWMGTPNHDWDGRGGRADMAGMIRLAHQPRPLCALGPMMSALILWFVLIKKNERI